MGLDYYTELLVKEVKESAPPLVKKECQFSEQGYEKNSRSTLTTFNALSEIEFQQKIVKNYLALSAMIHIFNTVLSS